MAWVFIVLLGWWASAEVEREPADEALLLSQMVHDVWGPEDGLPDAPIAWLAQTEEGYLWIGSDKGTARFDGVRFEVFEAGHLPPEETITAIRQAGERTDSLFAVALSGSIVSQLRDRSGADWAVTAAGALYRWDREQLSSIEIGEAGESVLLEDREGSIWWGTPRGTLHQFRAGTFTPAGIQDLPVFPALGVYEDAQGAVWMGTRGEGLIRKDADGERVFRKRDGLPSDVVISLAGDGEAIWAGTIGGGLARIRGRSISTFTTGQGLPGVNVFALHHGRDGLWIGTENGLALLNDAQFTTFGREDGLPGNSVSAILEDHRGRVWVGTHGQGLARRDRAGFKSYSERNGLLGNQVLAIFEDASGDIWVSSADAGLTRIRDDALSTVTEQQGLPDDIIYSLLGDEKGFVWMSTPSGIMRTTLAELNAAANGRLDALEWTIYTESAGLPSRNMSGGFHPASWKGRDGRLWFPTAAGVASVNPEEHGQKRPAPIVVVEGILVDHRAVDGSKPIELAASNESLVVQFTAPTYIHPTNMMLEYQLDGYNTSWQPADASRTATYSRLEPGSYTLRIRARTWDGVWSEQEATLAIIQAAPLYRYFWFQALLAAVVLSGFMAFFLHRMTKLRQLRAELAHTVKARTLDYHEEMKRSGDAQMVIDEQAHQLKAVERFKEQLFVTLSQELRTPLIVILGHLDNMLNGAYGTISSRLERQGQIMLRNARRLRVVAEQLLDVSRPHNGRQLPPASEPEEAGQGPEEEREGSRAEGQEEVLIIHPHEGSRKQLEVALKDGFRVEMVHDGQAGLSRVLSQPPALVIVGYELPDMDGLALARRIRQDAAQPAVPLLLLIPNQTLAQDELKGLDTDVDEVLAQPFAEAALRMRVRNVLARHRQAASLTAMQEELEAHVAEEVEAMLEDRLKYEAGLLASRDEAEASARLKSSILSTINREFRAPIAGIRGSAEVLEAEVEGELIEFAGFIKTSVDQLSTTLDSVLELAELESRPTSVQTSEQDVREVIVEVMARFRQAAIAKQLQFELQTPQGTNMVARVNRAGLMSALNHVVDNAIKFTAEGHVSIQVARVERYITITLADTGPGISSEMLPHVYEPFQHTLSEAPDQVDGWGIGLTIARRQLESMASSITIDSTPGVGTTVTIQCPAAVVTLVG